MVGFQNTSIFGEAGSEKTGKSDTRESAGANPPCPQCGSRKLWRDGLRYPMFGNQIQRWLCRDCGLRFSDPEDVQKAWSTFERIETIESKSLKSRNDKVTTRQICVKETKNLVAEQKTMLEVPQRTEVYLKGAIIDFMWQLKKKNYAEDTIPAYGFALHQLVEAGIDLFNPQSFLDKMPLQTQWTEGRKYNITKAYRCFLNLHEIKAKLPKYKLTRSLPYISPEEFLDQLIAHCNQQMAAFLQMLKETAARPGEAWKLEWDDLDVNGKKLQISHPEKGCNPRIRPISEKLLHMLLALPRAPNQKRIFIYKSKAVAGKTFRKMRQKLIQKFGDPELRKISFYTFRYWKATMEYRRTHDFGAVMVLLGHKSLRYVLLYAQLSEAYDTDTGYICKEATTRQEAKQLIEAGFEYVMDKEGVSLFRKLK
jgi:integrase